MELENVAAAGMLLSIRGSGTAMQNSTEVDEVGDNTPKSTIGRFIAMQQKTVNNLRLQLQHTETQRDMANIERDYYCREFVDLQSMYDNMKITHMSEIEDLKSNVEKIESDLKRVMDMTHMSEIKDLKSKLKRADENQDALQLLCVDFKRECDALKAERDEAVSELESTEDS
jgi:predicted  nucleic acid-binding Zn-ribbon protein